MTREPTQPDPTVVRHKFSGPAAKIARARAILAQLEREIEDFITNGAFSVKGTVTGNSLVIQSTFNAAPETISTQFGDFIHNLRSALDITAADCVRAAGESPKGVHFPFSESESELKSMIKRWKFDRAGTAATDYVYALRPYSNGNVPLRLIHDLDIQDKHMQILARPFKGNLAVVRCRESEAIGILPGFGPVKFRTDVKIFFPVGDGFTDRELIPVLHELVNLVDGIVNAFRAIANREFP